jgi:hypothetical protein
MSWDEQLEKLLEDRTRYFVQSSDVTVLPFGPYLSGAAWKFRTGLTLETTKSAVPVHAMLDGSITFHPADSTHPSRIVLKRGDPLSLAAVQNRWILPYWFPLTKYFVFENISSSSAGNAVAGLKWLQSSPKDLEAKLKSVTKLRPSAFTAKKIADLWLNNSDIALPVNAGEIIGSFNAGSQIDLRLVESVANMDAANAVFYNPCYLMAAWREYGLIKESQFPATLLDAFSDVTGPPSGVSRNPIVITGGGQNKITNAIAAAQNYDTILIADTSTYTDVVVITKPLNLMGSARVPASGTLPLPILDGNGLRRPVAFKGVTGGVACIVNLAIRNGKGAAPNYNGGGVLVEGRTVNNTIGSFQDIGGNVVISNCRVTNCTTPNLATLTSPWIFSEGFGGGICAYHASPAILKCVVDNNNAGGRGKGIGIFGYAWPRIFKCLVRNNGLVSTSGRGDGGGIAVEMASPKIEDTAPLSATTALNLTQHWNVKDLAYAKARYVVVAGGTISGNKAPDDGGGLYVSVASQVILRAVEVSSNTAIHGGGGIRITMGSSIILERGCNIKSNISNSASNANDDPNNKYSVRTGGGGLSSRNANVDLRGAIFFGNYAYGWAGGGVNFISTDEGYDEAADNWHRWKNFGQGMDYDWNNILWDIFLHKSSKLKIDASCEFTANYATALPLQLKNHGKGGAVYVLRAQVERNSGLPIPAAKKAIVNGQDLLKGPPIDIAIDSVTTSLASGNVGQFTAKPGNRLYLDDMTGNTTVLGDADLSPAGNFSYVSTPGS